MILIKNVSKVDFEIAHTHHLSKFPRYPTFSGVFTNFESYIPEMHKRGLTETLLHRSFRLDSS